MSKRLDYTLFLDESGGFVEAKRNKDAATDTAIPSQEVGFFASGTDSSIRDLAAAALTDSFDRARFAPKNEVKGSDLNDALLTQIVDYLLDHVEKNQWQLVRIVNHERVSFGDHRVKNQAQIVAELVYRIFLELGANSHGPIALSLVHDEIGLGLNQSVSKEALLNPINEQLGLAAVRRGRTKEQSRWSIPSLKFAVSADVPAIQICDLLSSLSRKNFARCRFPKVEARFKELLSTFDLVMTRSNAIERAADLIELRSYGLAVITIALSDYGSYSVAHEPPLRGYLQQIRSRLLEIGATPRDAQLGFVVSLLDEVIGQQRLATAGLALADWFQQNLVQPLKADLVKEGDENTLVWFEYAVNRWMTTAANHCGWIRQANSTIAAMKPHEANLAAQWHRVPLLMEGLIARAVHQTDCYEFDSVDNELSWAVESLDEQERLWSNRFSNATPIRYDIKAKALGTLTQTLILAGLGDQAAVDRARSISELAIEEFDNNDDKARQYQYRAHLETIAGDFEEARKYLLLSLGGTISKKPPTHNRIIARIIEELREDTFNSRFLLTHWLRMGARAALVGDADEFQSFSAAYVGNRMSSSPWTTGANREFPAHLALRFSAITHAGLGELPAALNRIKELQDICSENREGFTLKAIECAAVAEVACVATGTNVSRSLMTSEPGSTDMPVKVLPITDLLKDLPTANDKDFPSLGRLFDRWRTLVSAIEWDNPSNTKQTLLKISRDVCY